MDHFMEAKLTVGILTYQQHKLRRQTRLTNEKHDTDKAGVDVLNSPITSKPYI
jgi:hypothetical protein